MVSKVRIICKQTVQDDEGGNAETQTDSLPWSVQAVVQAAARGEDSLRTALQHFETQFVQSHGTSAKWGGVDHVNERGMTALVYAAGLMPAGEPQREAMNALIRCGAQVDKQCEGRSAFLCAQALSQNEAVLILSVERKRLRMLAAYATRAGRTGEVLTWLRETWPSPLNDSAFCGSYGYTPFCLACEEGCIELVEHLLKMSDCDPSITNHVRLSGWDCARHCGHAEVCALLLRWSEMPHNQCNART